MKVLAIDSSNHTLSLALCEDGLLLGELTNTVNRNHSTTLMPMLVALCASSNVRPGEIERIVVAAGPGSYTGLRIGVTTAKTLAWTLGVELVSVSSLAVLAANIMDFEGYLVPLFDARRHNVYSGVYQWQAGKLVSIMPDKHVNLADWLVELRELEGNIRFVGRDQELVKDELIEAFSAASLSTALRHNEVSGAVLAQLGLSESPLVDIMGFVPTYLKLVEAEENWLEKNSQLAGKQYVEKI